MQESKCTSCITEYENPDYNSVVLNIALSRTFFEDFNAVYINIIFKVNLVQMLKYYFNNQNYFVLGKNDVWI